MKSYKIIIAYDGTDYYGWQLQPDKLSIVQVLQDKFKIIFKKAITILGCSRTDAGVHAMGQVAWFSTDLRIDAATMLYAWNNLLAPTIVIRSLVESPKDFHPHHNILEKTYFYHLFLTRPLPFFARYGWFYKNTLNLAKLKEGLALFLGTHDFRSFYTGYEKKNTIRTISSIKIHYLARFNTYRLVIKGPGFLRHMLRRIIGACVDGACSETRTLYELRKALEEKNPRQALLTAPAHGLMLYKILYK